MGGVVRCDHCGAPHRRDAARTRFRCDWCGGDNQFVVERILEELLFSADDHSRDPASRVRDALASRGLVATLAAEAPRWIGGWQVVNERGEEFAAGVRRGSMEESLLGAMPSGTLRAMDGKTPTWAGGLGDRPLPEDDVDTIVEAARASFDDPDCGIVLVRLVWFGVAEFTAETGTESFRATQILGTDRVIFERLPSRAPRAAASPPRIAAWTGFFAVALLAGLLVEDAGARVLVELLWVGLGVVAWLGRDARRAGVRG